MSEIDIERMRTYHLDPFPDVAIADSPSVSVLGLLPNNHAIFFLLTISQNVQLNHFDTRTLLGVKNDRGRRY